MNTTNSDPQAQVDRYFDAVSRYWIDVYGSPDLEGLVYRRRMAAALTWARELGLARGARVLDVGCGAGLLTIALADLGLRVTGTDSSPEMVRTATENIAQRGAQGSIEVRQADAHGLPFEADEFELVTALGLLPWLHDPASAVRELGRVLAPRGTMILTADNRLRLNRLLEPRENPLLSPLRPVKRALWPRSGEGTLSAPSYRHLPGEVDEMLAAAGIAVVRRTTVGYGPFTVMGRRSLPDSLGRALDERLQRAAADRVRLRAVGWHYLVAGRKRSMSSGSR